MQAKSFTATLLLIGALIFSIITVAGLKLFSRYQPYSAFFSYNPESERKYAVVMYDAHIRGRSHGHPSWRIDASQASVSIDQSKIEATELHNGIIYKDSKPFASLSAYSARYLRGIASAQLGLLTLQGAVKIHSIASSGASSTTWSSEAARLNWDCARSELSSPQQIEIKLSDRKNDRNLSVKASDIVWDGADKSIAFLSKTGSKMVEATAIAPKISSLPYQAKCDMATWNMNSSNLKCAGNVQAKFTLPKSNHLVVFNSERIDWDSKTGSVAAPLGSRASIENFGQIETCSATADISSESLAIGPAHISICSDTPIAPSDTKEDAQKTKKQAAADNPNTIHIFAESGGHEDDEQEVYKTDGPVTFKQGDARLKTIGVVYDKKKKTAVAQSPVLLTDPDSTMTGDHGTIDFGKKIATIEGKVRLLQYQEKKDDDTKTNEADKKQSDDDNSLDAASHSPAEMTCDKIVYNYRTKQAVFTGHLVITQKSRTITADHGTYDATKKIATLGGDVVDKEKDGGVLKTDKATASLKKGDEWVDIPGPHSYDFTPSDEDNPRPK